MATARTFAGSKFMLTLEGVTCGFVDSVDGGGIVAEVAEQTPVPPSVFAAKRIARAAFEQLEVRIGLTMAHDIYDWIAATLNGSFDRKNGSITTADTNLNAQSEQQFLQALITEVGFPACDAASKDALLLTLGLTPQRMTIGKGSGKLPLQTTTKQQRAVASNFRLEVDGVDTSRVRRIEPFTATVQVPADIATNQPVHVPARLEFPNLRVTFTDGPTTASWQSWIDEFVLKGLNDPGHEKRGAIVFLAPDLKTELARVVLHGVGIFALRRSRRSASDTTVPTVTADLYCERMELHVGKPTGITPPPIPKPLPTPAPPTRIAPIRAER